MKLPLESITVNRRRRTEFGDIAGLAASIQKYGLLHPIVVDDEATLVAGERRLRAVQSLGWDSVEVRDLGELTQVERDEIELEENLQRKDLTPVEQSRTVVKLAETAKRVIQEQLEFRSDSERNSPGRPKEAGSVRGVSERIGVPPATIVKAQQHVETAEQYPELQGPNWKQYHVLEAREKLEKLPEPERATAVALVTQPGIDPRGANEMLGNLATKPPEDRARIYAKAQSADERERSDAITEAWNRPAMPDPRLTLAVGMAETAKRAIRMSPEDPMAARFRHLLNETEALVTALKEYRRDS